MINRSFINKFSMVFVLILMSKSMFSQEQNKDQFDYQKVLDYCIDKSLHTVSSLSDNDKFPRYIEADATHWESDKVENWISGFWPGILWYSFEASNNLALKQSAALYTQKQQVIMDKPIRSHDLGFMLYCSYGNGYRLTKNPVYKTLLLSAADSLATLYNPTVGTILSWPSKRKNNNWPHHTIIDNMMNLELLFWAAKNGGDKNLYNIAVKHAETTMKHHIRTDNTTYHVVFYNDKNGDFIKGKTHQGYADDSLWARGQAWGIYGFTMCYRETGKVEFMETAIKLADAYIKNLPNDLIPYWDFNDPSIPNTPRDASAAAVVASALLELSSLNTDALISEKYKGIAIKMLQSLSSDMYLSKDKNDAFLLHSTGNKPKNKEVDVSIIYADYYFIEALLLLKKMSLKG